MPRISATKAGTAQVRPYVSEEIIRQTLREESRAKRPDLATMLDDLDEVESAYRGVHNALKGALQEFVDAAAVGRWLAGGAGDSDAGSYVDPSTGGPLPRA
jgi:hypothetical protein